MRWGWLLIGLLGVPACAGLQPVALQELPSGDKPAVFVADGAGDFRACSAMLRTTAEADGLSLDVVTFVWSHGYLRNVIDQTDYEHSRVRGTKLAELVRKQLDVHPATPVTLLGHSAGSAVVLAAAEQLPAGSIERIVLLSPSISESYDLRPALTATRNGIDAFVSDKDWIWLGLLVRLFGTTDDPLAARAAGRFGFAVPPHDPVYAGLRLHRWTPAQVAEGHDGGHFGCYQPRFLRRYVFPVVAKAKSP